MEFEDVIKFDGKREAIINRLAGIKRNADRYTSRFHQLEAIRNFLTIIDVSCQTIAASINAIFMTSTKIKYINIISLILISVALMIRTILMAMSMDYKINDNKQKSMSLHAIYNSLNTKLINNNLLARDYESINHEIDIIQNLIIDI